jgi:hypothetical protein
MKLQSVWHCAWSDDPSNQKDWECISLISGKREEIVSKLIERQEELLHNFLSKEDLKSRIWEDEMSLNSIKEATCEGHQIGWWQIIPVELELKPKPKFI